MMGFGLGALGATRRGGFGSGGALGRAGTSNPKNTILAAPASFVLTGQSAGLIYTRTALVAALGTFALTGQAAGTLVGRSLTAAQGSFTLTGQDANLVKATPGAYTLTAAQGTFVLTGDAMTPVVDYKLPSDLGTFALSGQAAGLLTGHSLTAAQGTFALTGIAATLTKSSSFALAFQDKAASAAKTTTVSYGPFTLASGATRTIAIIQWFGGATPGIASMTINGVSCTLVSSTFGDGSTDRSIAVYESNSAVTGGSINVSITYNSAPTYDSAVALYNLTTTTPLASGGANNPDSFGVSTTSVGPASITSGGGGVFGIYDYSNGTSFTVTSGNAVIDATIAAPSGGPLFTFGHTTATGSVTVSFSMSGSAFPISTLAGWGP